MDMLSSVFPFIAFAVDLIIMIICLRKISSQTYFKYFNSYTWMVIVVLGSIIGQLAYLILEGNENI